MARPRTPPSSYGRLTAQAVHYRVGPKGRRLVVIPADEVPPKHDFWRARTRYRFESGAYRQIERFAKTKAKAEEALRKALIGIQESTAAEVKRETRIRDLGERFLIEKAGRAPRTLETYERSVRRVIVPKVGDLAVSEATPDRLQRLLAQIQVEHGPGEAKKARAVLSGMMGLAARSDAVKTNPVRELAPIEAKAKGATAIPLDVMPVLLEAVRADERLRQMDMPDLIVFLAGTGARISEAIDLDWADVEIVAPAGIPTIGALVTIRKSKTTAGERRIVAPASVGASLARRQRRDGPVFPTPFLKRRDRRNTSNEWQAARERLQLGDYTFHSFRKYVATALDKAGLSAREIAEYLGHANPSLTQDVYMSRTVGGRRAANALDSMLAREG